MLTFLRKIRKSLIETGSAKKYFIYAIGEILLVMVGILLALQVNNWNEGRKDRILEKELISGFHESLISNKDRLTMGLKSWQSTTLAIEILTKAIESNQPFQDSLKYHFREAHRVRGNNLNGLDYAGYKALENKGFNIVTNKSLRTKIISLFESSLPALASTNNQIDFDNSGFHSEYIVRNFIVDQYDEYPLDYDKVMNDQYYFSILKRLDYNLNRKIGRVGRTLEKVENVIKLLEQEMKQ